MVTYLTDSEGCCSVSKTDREQAWDLVRVLLNLDRPSRPAELADRRQVLPDFVKFLCSIPDSPLFLTEDLYVTLSLASLLSAGEFALSAIFKSVPRITLRVSGSKRLMGDVQTYFRKRKRQRIDKFLLTSAKRRLLSFPEDEDDQTRLALADSILSVSSTKAHVDFADKLIRDMSFLRDGFSIAYNSGTSNQDRAEPPFLLSSNLDILRYGSMKIEDEKKNDGETNIIVQELLESVYKPECQHSFLNNTEIDLNIPQVAEEEAKLYNLQLSTTESQVVCKEIHLNRMDFREKQTALTCQEVSTECDNSPVEAGLPFSHDCEAPKSRILRNQANDCCEEGQILINSRATIGGQGDTIPTYNTAKTLQLLENHPGSMVLANYNDATTWARTETTGKVESYVVRPSIENSTTKMQLPRSSPKAKTKHKDTTLGTVVLSESLNCSKGVNSHKQEEPCKRDQKSMSMKQKLKQNRNHSLFTKENQNQSESNALPNFESFIIEEEEGSGGYGTVYRARRKNDGKTFAIKCPHVNAHLHHVTNEMKMLERFGGRNFVIKYEGSFKSNNSECFVLEHVEHDRPEVLKKEIDIFELQWYGYCMFRALASLHKQGIVHRDIKPGNFLFSRKLSKGYLIDFNLAMDLHQKYSTTSKSKMSSIVTSDYGPLPSTKTVPPIKGQKVTSSRFLGGNQEIAKDCKPSFEPKSMKKRADMSHSKAYVDLRRRHKLKTQGGDGSGITSTKDATSTRTPSGERQREPLPSQGRKEYISLVQEVMRSPNQKGISFPASQRKRIAATPGKVDKQLVYLTPMPLHSTGSAVAGAGLYKNKGDGKQKREGPCVGTKGFRAPEVLLKSPHQGPKVDVWSAGVTLLYLMIGRSPFVGDPEQNIKDIAKLRGSEDLWEVAKLHNRESSFPVELFDVQFLPATELKEWCKTNTKRPEFLNMIPRSLFDLIDKCLTVNPRLRISAEEALNHEFFANCHESLRKHRLLRRELTVDSATANLSHERTQFGL